MTRRVHSFRLAGIREFRVSPLQEPHIKQAIRQINLEELAEVNDVSLGT